MYSTEYTGENFQHILRNDGIKVQTTGTFSPENHGVAKQKNRTLCESVKKYDI